MTHHIVLSGCSGGGKSTLLAELVRRGFVTVEEPGRRIVQQELSTGSVCALPWIDLEAFAKRAIEIAIQDRVSVLGATGWVFFDRGLIDAAVALEHATGTPASSVLSQHARFHKNVFLAPPWPEIFVADAERQGGLDQAIGEYERLLDAFTKFGYEPIILPKTDVRQRADFVLSRLQLPMIGDGPRTIPDIAQLRRMTTCII